MDSVKKTFITVDGKRIPLFKIPTGVSGLTAEAKATQNMKEKYAANAKRHADSNKKNDVEEYLETGEVNSSEVIDYMSSSPEFSGMELFDKIND